MAAKKPLSSAISCHAWNKDGSMVALSPSTSEVHIYQTGKEEDTSKWSLVATLGEHNGFVSSIDWSPVTNLIVTCGHDRNAYVWNLEDGKWKPTLVICRLDRAATSVRWSPDGRKFAVASGSKTVPICYFEAKNNWWIAKMIKKHKSTVTCVTWSPNSRFILTGSTDNRARIFSAFVDVVDSQEDDGFGAVFPDQFKFGEALVEFDQGGSWVNAVAWAPGGKDVAFASHGSSISFARLEAGFGGKTQQLSLPTLPFQTILFAGDDLLVAAGWSCNLSVFSRSGGAWAFKDELDKGAGAADAATKSKFGATRQLWAGAANQGLSVDGAAAVETKLDTRHQNTITGICLYKDHVVSSCGIDGNVFFWKL